VILDILLVKCATAEMLVPVHSIQPQANTAAPSNPPVAPSTPQRSAQPRQEVQQTSFTAPAATVAPTPTPVAPAQATSWEGLIAHVRPHRPLLASILEHGSCVSFPKDAQSESELLICFRPEDAYFREQLQSRVYSEQLSGMCKEYFGKHVRIRIELRDSVESLAGRREREIKEREQRAKDSAQNHPIILEAKALFGGELGPIEILDSETGNHAHA
jgi:hypothetical protein